MNYTQQELESLGFKSIGKNVKVSKLASIYSPEKISIGSNVRIDDFCIISAGAGGISIGDYVHIAAYCSLIGAAEITIESFVGISSRVSVYSSSDDYTGEFLTNPTVPMEFRRVHTERVTLKKHVLVGAGSVILPGVVLSEGVSVGALSKVTKSFEEFLIVAGNPAKVIRERKRDIKDLEIKLIKGC